MKVSIVHPFLVERTLMKHEITTRPNQPLLFFFFVRTGLCRSSDRNAAHHSSKTTFRIHPDLETDTN